MYGVDKYATLDQSTIQSGNCCNDLLFHVLVHTAAVRAHQKHTKQNEPTLDKKRQQQTSFHRILSGLLLLIKVVNRVRVGSTAVVPSSSLSKPGLWYSSSIFSAGDRAENLQRVPVPTQQTTDTHTTSHRARRTNSIVRTRWSPSMTSTKNSEVLVGSIIQQ